MGLREMMLRVWQGITAIDVMRGIWSRMGEEITNQREIIGSFGDDQDSQSLSGHMRLPPGVHSQVPFSIEPKLAEHWVSTAKRAEGSRPIVPSREIPVPGMSESMTARQYCAIR